MRTEVKLNMKNIQGMEELITKGLIEAAETILQDIHNSQTLPLESGVMQDDSTFVDFSKAQQGKVDIVTDTPYARYQYFGKLMLAPNGSAWAKKGEEKHLTKKDLVHNKEHNPNAGPFWFEPYITGDKKDMAQERFESYIKSRVGG